MRTLHLLFSCGLILSAFLLSCRKDKVDIYITELYEDGEELSAGSCTIYDESDLAFSYQVKGLTQTEKLIFFVGNSFFKDVWVEAPSSTTARDGLGPLFNARSCTSCHFKDGRGEPFKNKGLLLRISTAGNGSNGPIADLIYGGQIQDNALSGQLNESDFSIAYEYLFGVYPDGSSYQLRKPTYTLGAGNYGAISSGLQMSPRVGQQMIGLGLLELVPESDLIALSDEFDANSDGISGRPNYVWDPYLQQTVIGRFGWKSNVGSIYTQVAGAFNGDIGITSHLFPSENHTNNQTSLFGLPNGGSPEIDTDDLEKVVLYSRTLGVPVRRNYKQQDVLEGKGLFNAIQCASCHTPMLRTGNTGSIGALKNKTIRPFTDLLLHDMGQGLADNRSDYNATGTEWRTQPLWGIGLINSVNNHTYLLHDGRARSIEEAILWHGGEALNSRNKFMNLTLVERVKLLKFIQSL